MIVDGKIIIVQFNIGLLLPCALLLLRLLLQLLWRWARLLLHLLLLSQVSSFTGVEAKPQIIITSNPGPSVVNCQRCVLLASQLFN
jgi:hypothetical protein